jgi:hypothetical protein
MLSTYHGGHYKVYNLCSEKSYDPARFRDGEFAAYPVDDHEVPPLPMLFEFVKCALLNEFLCPWPSAPVFVPLPLGHASSSLLASFSAAQCFNRWLLFGPASASACQQRGHAVTCASQQPHGWQGRAALHPRGTSHASPWINSKSLKTLALPPPSHPTCRDAREYLAEHRSNVTVIHCKAGKGRTGICIAALLLCLGKAHTWSAALAQFAIMRTSNCVGVTIASQRRWVQYYDAIRDHATPPAPCPIRMCSIRINSLPGKYANRVIIVVQQREYDKEHGYHPRTIVAANLLPPLTATSSMFGSFMCGIPSCTGVGMGDPSAPFPSAEQSSSTCADSVCSGVKDPQVECAISGVSSGARAYGSGWRLTHEANGDLLLEMETDEVRPACFLIYTQRSVREGSATCAGCEGHMLGTPWAAQFLHVPTELAANLRALLQDPEEWQISGDFKIQVFLDSISPARSLFWCWHNTSFMTGTHSTLSRESLDKVHRCMPPAINMTLQWQPGERSMFPLQSAPVQLLPVTKALCLKSLMASAPLPSEIEMASMPEVINFEGAASLFFLLWHGYLVVLHSCL